jgi:hypothetical protein
MVATHGSAFASIGRAEAAQRVRAREGAGRGAGGGGGAKHGKSYVVARDGMCFPWPDALGGAPMSSVGSHFEDTSCNAFSKALDTVTLYRACTRALTFENVWQAGAKDAIGDFRGPLRRPIDLHVWYPCDLHVWCPTSTSGTRRRRRDVYRMRTTSVDVP